MGRKESNQTKSLITSHSLDDVWLYVALRGDDRSPLEWGYQYLKNFSSGSIALDKQLEISFYGSSLMSL